MQEMKPFALLALMRPLTSAISSGIKMTSGQWELVEQVGPCYTGTTFHEQKRPNKPRHRNVYQPACLHALP